MLNYCNNGSDYLIHEGSRNTMAVKNAYGVTPSHIQSIYSIKIY